MRRVNRQPAQGGQFKCPSCQAVNAVGGQVQPGYAPQAQQVGGPQYAAAPPKPTKDNRKAYVLGAFMVLGVVAVGMGWAGVLIGLPLLGWGIAGALGKVKSPGALIFPESAGKTGVTALGIALGGFVTTCSIMGGASQAQKAERDAAEAQEKEEREAADKAAKEKREAEEAAAKAAHEAELLANVGKAATVYKSGLDAIEALVNDDKMKEASAKLAEVTAAVDEYQKLDPVPGEIAALLPRGVSLDSQITEALKIIVAAENLEKNTAKADELTKGTKDGEAWSTAQGLWQSALKNIETLETAGAAHADRVPAGLPGQRKAIEKKLGKAEGIVAKYEKQQVVQEAKREKEEAAMAAFNAACGEGGCTKVTAKQLLGDYAANEAGAQARWKGKRVAVTGVVDSISLDFMDDAVVSITGGRQRFALQTIHCQPKNNADANRLRKGQNILAIGTVGTEVIGSIMLEDCVF